MTRVRDWVWLGVLLPVGWLAVVLVPMSFLDPEQAVLGYGYGLLTLLVVVVPCVVLCTVAGVLVLRSAGSVPAPGRPRRGRAVAVRVGVAGLASTLAASAVLALGTATAGLSPVDLALSGAVVGAPVTVAASVALLRHRPGAAPAPATARPAERGAPGSGPR